MANFEGRNSKGQFKKGNKLSKGRGGRPKMSEEQKALALNNRTQFKNILNQYLTLTLDEIQDQLNEQKLPALDMIVLRHLEIALRTGDMDRLDWSIDHVLGARPKQTEVTVKSSNIDLKKLSTEELQQLKQIAEKQEGEE